jgi:hypothetical protein
VSLYGTPLTQVQLQSSFYSLYDPEVQATVEMYLLIPDLKKDQKKSFPKLAKTFLLDNMELNSKSRCVFSWSGNVIQHALNYDHI